MVTEPTPPSDPAAIEKKDQMVDVALGNELGESQASEITRSSLTRVIVIAGPGASGKTTLLAALNDMFQRGPFQEYRFAGSKTLLAFESRSFDVRIDSGRSEPDMEKTKVDLDNLRFLHLRIRKSIEASKTQDLLFSDISGENFRQAKNSSDDCKKLWVLKRADRLVLLFDGGNLALKEKRQESKSFGMDFLRSCLDSGMIGLNTFVDVVISKKDIINVSEAKDETEKFISQMNDEIRNRFGLRLGKLTFAHVAVLPKMDQDLNEGWGLAALFPAWVEESPVDAVIRESQPTHDYETREFSRYRTTNLKTSS